MTYILFYKGTRLENEKATWWDRFICFVTGSRFSHVEIAWLKQDNVYTCYSASPRDGGVRSTRVNYNTGHWYVIETGEAASLVIISNLGKRYDYIGLIGAVVKLPWFSSKDKWFCSEIIAETLGLKDSWKFTPEDLFRHFTKE